MVPVANYEIRICPFACPEHQVPCKQFDNSRHRGPRSSPRQSWQVKTVAHQHTAFSQNGVRLIPALESERVKDGIHSAGRLHGADPFLTRVSVRRSSCLNQVSMLTT